jgi:MFS family permease
MTPSIAPTLWSRNFTIITIGTIISAIGGVGINFAIGVLIFDQTQSTLLTAIFAAVSMIPHFVLPMIVGPFIDRFPRRKIIYTSDFLMAALFLLIAWIARDGYFNYLFYMGMSLILGINGVIYSITYESFFPELIPAGHIQKGYTVSSLIYPLSAVLVLPIASWVFKEFGVAYLFLAEAMLLFTAALFETQIKIVEHHVAHAQSANGFTAMVREAITYLKDEAGLRSVFVYFFFLMMAGEGLNVLLYPYFQRTPGLDVTLFSFLMSASTAGRLMGGIFHYVVKIPSHRRFTIAAVVYFSLSLLNGSLLYLSYFMMLVVQFLIGFLSINSFNIRMSATQSYVPSEKRGRINGFYHILTTVGMLIGRLLTGYLGEQFDYPTIVLGLNLMSLVAFAMIILGNRKAIAAVYNRTV